MEELNPYAARVLNKLESCAPWEKQFLQSVKELFLSISPVLNKAPQYQGECILERITVPKRTIGFQVQWQCRCG